MPVLRDPRLRRIALVRLSVGLGDLICSAPAWRALRRTRPDLRITVVTWSETAPVLARLRRYADELLPFPGYPGIPERPPQPEALPDFLVAAHARHFDLAVQCYGDNPRANEVTELLGANRIAGFRPGGWEPARDPGLHVPYPRETHEVDRHLRLMERLGAEVPPGAGELEFPLRAADHAEWARLRDRFGLRPGEYAVLHPGAGASSRRWPPERFAEVGDALARRGLRIVLGGVRAERYRTGRVAAAMTQPSLDLAGRTSLGGYALLLREAHVLVGNDTGATQLAAAVGGRTVTVFLAGDPVRWAHPPPRHRIARVEVGCNPCPHLDCPIDFRCAYRLGAEEVLSEIDALDEPG